MALPILNERGTGDPGYLGSKTETDLACDPQRFSAEAGGL